MQSDPANTLNEYEDYERDKFDGNIFSQPTKTRITLTRPPASSWSETDSDWPLRNIENNPQGFSSGRGRFNSRHNSFVQDDDISWDPELERDAESLAIPRTEKKRYARDEQRTIMVKNLSDRATHKDIVNFIRGGLVLDIFLRTNDRTASISFVEGSAAQEFMSYVKKKDIYVHGKRVSLP